MWSPALILAAAMPGVLAGASLSPVIRHGSKLFVDGEPWKAVGANVYWLGLDENVVPPAGQPYYAPFKASYPDPGRIPDILATIRALGGNFIRGHTLGVSVGNPLSVMPTLGAINDEAFTSIDWAVYQAGQYGIRLVVPLIDNYDYYHGGKYTFLRWMGFNLTQTSNSNDPQIQQFYNNATIVAAFKDYVKKLLTHKNKYNHLTYAEDPTIMAYETGNELNGPVWGDKDCPAAWVKEIASFVKKLAPKKLIVDGTYGINETHLDIPEVDIFSDHFYPVNVTQLESDLKIVGAANKSYYAGEYDWLGYNGGSTPSGDSLETFYGVIENSTVAMGDTFWSLFGRDLPNCNIWVNHTDGFTMQYGNPLNSDYVNSRIQLVRKHSVKLSRHKEISANASLPSVACPAPAL